MNKVPGLWPGVPWFLRKKMSDTDHDSTSGSDMDSEAASQKVSLGKRPHTKAPSFARSLGSNSVGPKPGKEHAVYWVPSSDGSAMPSMFSQRPPKGSGTVVQDCITMQVLRRFGHSAFDNLEVRGTTGLEAARQRASLLQQACTGPAEISAQVFHQRCADYGALECFALDGQEYPELTAWGENLRAWKEILYRGEWQLQAADR